MIVSIWNNNKPILLLSSVLLVLGAYACGSSEPLPDIDATVEARLAIAKASLVAPTAVPLPTHAPLPTYTPVPTHVPEVVIKEVEIIKEVPVEVLREIIKEVPVEKVVVKEVIKEVIKEVPVQVIVEVEKVVVVEKEVVKQVEVVVTATPTAMPTATPTAMPTATPAVASHGTNPNPTAASTYNPGSDTLSNNFDPNPKDFSSSSILVAGLGHTCLRTTPSLFQELFCWGSNLGGKLGQGHFNNIGDQSNEMDVYLNDIDLGISRWRSHETQDQWNPYQRNYNQNAGFYASSIAAGDNHNCAISSLNPHSLICWGSNLSGQLGQGNVTNIEHPWEARSVPLGWESVKQVTAGSSHTCALADIGKGENVMKCWGLNNVGQLGHDSINNSGDNYGEMGGSLPITYLGEQIAYIDAGSNHTCALLIDMTISCWGNNSSGQLGLGDDANRGDGPTLEMGNNLPNVDLGSDLVPSQISVGGDHTCVLFKIGSVKCWGDNRFGQLGYGHTENIGDDIEEMGDNLPFVKIDNDLDVIHVEVGHTHTCVILDNAQVKCWGSNGTGQLGQGNIRRVGYFSDTELLRLPTVDLGTGKWALQLALGEEHTCALLNDFTVKCWGSNIYGTLGQGHTSNIGDNPNEMGDNLKPIEFRTNCTVNYVPGSLQCWD